MVIKHRSTIGPPSNTRSEQTETTEVLNNIDVAVYALNLLGGIQKMVHTEDIAVKCFELAPQSFSWTKFPQYPATEPARSALMDARKGKNGTLVRGNNQRKLWMITPTGVEWLNENRVRIEQSLQQSPPPKKRQELLRKLHEISNHKSFKAFQASGEAAKISEVDFVDSLKCTLNSSPEDLLDKLMRFRSIATDIHQRQIIDYLNFCQKHFSHLLESKK